MRGHHGVREDSMKISRRNFIKNSAVAAAAMAVAPDVAGVAAAATTVPLTPGPGNKWPGRVVVNFNKSAATKSTTGWIADEKTVRSMVDQSIMKLTGKSTVGEAWKEIFPSSLSLNSKIAIKIGLLNQKTLWNEPYTLREIVDGLLQMDFNGTPFPASNIVIYDGNNDHTMNSVGLTAASFPAGVVRTHYGPMDGTKDFYNPYLVAFGDGGGTARNAPYFPVLSKTGANFLINLFSLRGHNILGAGKVTLGFKNHYGSFHIVHPKSETDPGSVATYLRDINCLGPVFEKTVLSVCSGIFGTSFLDIPTASNSTFDAYTRIIDPSITTTKNNPTTLIMSTDPISAEVQAWKILQLNSSLPKPADPTILITDKRFLPDYLKASGGMTGALSTTYNIGQIDESQMVVYKILNNTAVLPGMGHQAIAGPNRLAVTPLRGGQSTSIEFVVPNSRAGSDALIEIVNVKGAVVRRFNPRVTGAVNSCSWDNRDAHGGRVGSGTYLVRLIAGEVTLSAKATVVI
jgi:hypothetical protein